MATSACGPLLGCGLVSSRIATQRRNDEAQASRFAARCRRSPSPLSAPAPPRPPAASLDQHHDSTERAVGAALNDQHPEERDLLPRRRHGHPGDHRRPLLPGRQQRAQRRPDAVHRLRHDLVGEAGRRRRRTCPTTTPTRPRPGRRGRPARRRSTSASRRARAAAINVPGTNLKTVLELAQKQGMKVGDVSTAEITDATPAVLASHISLRGCQGPANMAACPTETKARAASARSPSRRSTTRSTCCSAAAAPASTQTITGGPDAGKNVIESAQAKGYQYVTDAAGLERVSNGNKPVLGLFNTGNMSLEWTGPAASLGKGNAPARLQREPAPGQRAEPGGDDAEGDRPAGRTARASSSRSRAPRSTSRTTPPTPAARSARRSPSTDAIGVALDYQEDHPDTLVVVTADHSHTSQIVGEDASGSGCRPATRPT